MQQDYIWIIGGLLGVLQAWFWYDKSKSDREVSELKKSLNDLTYTVSQLASKQQHYATHNDVKELIRESIEPLRNDQRETKDLAREINSAVNQLARDIAVLNVLRGLENGKNKDFSN